MLKLNFMVSKSIRPLAFSLVTASSLIALLSPTLAMDPPQAPTSSSEWSVGDLLRAITATKKKVEALEEAQIAAEAELDLAMKTYSEVLNNPFIARNDDRIVHATNQWKESGQKEAQLTKELKGAKEELTKLQKLRAEQVAAKPKGQQTQNTLLAGEKFEMALNFFHLTRTGLESKNFEEVLRCYDEGSFSLYEGQQALDLVKQEVENEQNPAQKEFLKSIISNLMKINGEASQQDNVLRDPVNEAGERLAKSNGVASQVVPIAAPKVEAEQTRQVTVAATRKELQEVEVLLAAKSSNVDKLIEKEEDGEGFDSAVDEERMLREKVEFLKSVLQKTEMQTLNAPTVQAQPLPGQRTFAKPVNEAAEAEAKKAAEVRAIAEAKVAFEAQQQLAAHQKWMDEQAEQRKQAAVVVQPLRPQPAVPVKREQPPVPAQAVVQPRRPQLPVLVQPPVVQAQVQDNSMESLGNALHKVLNGEKNGPNDATLEAGRFCMSGGMREKKEMVARMLSGGNQQKVHVEKPADAQVDQPVPFVAMKKGAPPPPPPAKPFGKVVKKPMTPKPVGANELIEEVQVTVTQTVMDPNLLRAMALNAKKLSSSSEEDDNWVK